MTYITNKDFYLEVVRGNVDGSSTVHFGGVNENVGTSLEFVTSSAQYRMLTAAASLEFLSDNANDTSAGSGARSVTIVGLDANGDIQTQTHNTNGTTPVSVTGTWLRVTAFYVETSGTYGDGTSTSHAGTITLRNAADASTWSQILQDSIGNGAAMIGCTTAPSNADCYILALHYSIQKNKAVDLYLYRREDILTVAAPYSALILDNKYTELQGTGTIEHFTREKFPALTDIIVMAKTTSGTASVTVEIEMINIEI